MQSVQISSQFRTRFSDPSEGMPASSSGGYVHLVYVCAHQGHLNHPTGEGPGIDTAGVETGCAAFSWVLIIIIIITIHWAFTVCHAWCQRHPSPHNSIRKFGQGMEWGIWAI